MDHHYKIYLDSIYECGPSLLFKKANCDQQIYQDRNGPAHVKYENEEESPCVTTNRRKRKANNAKKVCIDWNDLLNDSEFNENYRNFLKCLRYPSNEEGITTFCFNNDVSFKCERGRRKEPIIDEQEEDSGADISDDYEGNDDDGAGNKENKDYIYDGDNVEAFDVDDDSEDNTDIDYEHDEERQEDTDIDDSDNVEVTDVDDNDSGGVDNEYGIDVEDETDIDDEDDADENNATEEEVEEEDEDDDVGDGEDECEGEDGDENEDTDIEDDEDKYVDTDDDEDDDDVDKDDDDEDDDEDEGVYSCTEKSSQISISSTEYSSFDIRLKKETKRPFNQHEYDRLMRKAAERKAIIRDRKLRSGDKTYQTNVAGKSYFDHFPDVKAKVLAANKPKALKLLRGFFFWLQNLCHEGSYQPWVGRYRV